MSYNGSGTFVINTAGQPVVSGTVISSTAFNALTADLATGLSTAITKDGQTTPTANIPMGNNKITGLAVGTAATDAANLSQVQSTTAKLINSVAGADTVTGTMSPTLTAYAAGQMFYWVAAGTNTGAVTLNIDSLGAKAVTRDGSTALAAGDIRSGEVVVVVYDGTRFQVVSQINSSGDATFANVSITSALNVGGVATFSGGTANGVTYLNGSKQLTSGTALTFDGSSSYPTFKVVGTQEPSSYLQFGIGYAQWYNSYGNIGLNAYLSGEGKSLSSQVMYFAGYNNTADAYLQLFDGKVHVAGGGNVGIGNTSPAAKLDVTGTAAISGNLTLSGGTANGVLYLNGSKVATSGSALTFSGTVFGVNGSAADGIARITGGASNFGGSLQFYADIGGGGNYYRAFINGINESGSGSALTFSTTTSGNADPGEKMRLDRSGNLGIGTSSPAAKLHVVGENAILDRSGGDPYLAFYTSGSATNVNIYGGSSTGFRVFTGGSERLRVDSSGNLGLGVTPSAWSSYYRPLQAGTNGAFAGGNDDSVFTSNAYYDGNWKYITSSVAATRLRQTGGTFTFSTAASGTAGNTISFTQAMTLDASGNLLVGTTTANGKISLYGTAVATQVTIDGTGRYKHFEAYSSGTRRFFTGFDETSLVGYMQTDGAHPLAFYTNGTERARITSGGYFKASNTGTYNGSTGTYHELRSDQNQTSVYIENTSTSLTGGVSGVRIQYSGASPNTTTRSFLYCDDSTALRAEIRSNGGLANYSANDVNLASDERLKKDISPLNTAWDKVKNIEVVNYRYKDCNEGDPLLYGVIAQQVQPIVPELVVVTREATETDPEYYGIREQPMYWLAIKALQEAMIKIEKLEAEVAALKGA